MKQYSIINVQGLRKSYSCHDKCVSVLKGIDITIAAGESVAMMGPSGSGKSTLLHLLGCLDRPTTGQYLLNGQDVAALNDAELAALRAAKIGIVFQFFNLIPQLSVWKNLEVPFLYQSIQLPHKEKQERIVEALGRVGLLHRLKHLPSQLSGGEMQRVAIARALAIRPWVLLADEPTGNLDTKTGQLILQLFQELHAQGTTLVIVTHDQQVAACCHRLVYLQDGQIIDDSLGSA